MKELFLIHHFLLESRRLVQGGRKRTEKSHSGAELPKFIVSNYGLPRYLGRRLVGALVSDRVFTVIRVVPRIVIRP